MPKVPYRYSGDRIAEERAAIIAEVDRTPAVILAQAILAALDCETRAKVLEQLLPSTASISGRQAFELARCTMLNFGEQMDLMKALAVLRAEPR